MVEQHGKTLVPQIRFAGFTDPWEQRKLGELFEESDERASDREILSVSVANGIYPASESDRETNPGASLANYKIVHSGDVVYNSMRMWQGAVDASRYGGIVSPAYVVARPNSEVYARFFARLLRQPMLLKQYQQVSQGNSKDTQVLKFDDFASIGISMPASENEQRRIGAFFDRLDSLITLHQRKLELLRNIKKSMLDKMFPKGGSLYPEIRFAGFTDPWEQRKLGELYQKNDERNTDGLGSERTLSVASMTFNSTGNGADESSLPNYKRLRLGDIAFEGHANKEFAYGRFVLNDAGNGIMSPRFTCLRPIVEQEYSFWKYFIHSEKVMRPILVNSTKSGTMMNELVVEDFLEQEILVPSLPEQRRIGAFFDRLDSLITLHQRKLELLRNIKKSMLDKMFV
ncbi:restriction endonuclease subunit S [Bifidobacterium pseudocatenulatum]|uniref:restriction endonuclease subunit S n=2 Tax=Bifidobacterium pseudocatenulatum TaxID=28026 RepID=UPI0032F08D61